MNQTQNNEYTGKRPESAVRMSMSAPTAHKTSSRIPIDSQPSAELLREAADALADTSDALYKITVFLSYATPFNALQTEFLARVIDETRQNLLFPRTLGRSDQNTETPLTAIRRMVLSSFGLIAVAFRRAFVPEAISRPGSPREQTFTNFWLTSPYLQIEPSMAYQQGLPIALFVENGVSMNNVFGGILELGATPFTIITFSLNSEQDITDFFNSVFWEETFLDWVGNVRSCYKLRTQPEDNCGC
jgi:hypothetical protein